MSGFYQRKPYSPSRQVFPRRFLEPWRILVVVVVIFLLFFFRFDTSSTPVAISTPSDVSPIEPPKSQAPLGFRPLNESKIAIVTFHTDQKSYTHLSMKNKYRMLPLLNGGGQIAHRLLLDYAKLHGYDFILDLEANNDRGLMWHKFDMVQRAINSTQYDWVWWIDFDTLVMNMNIKVEDIIADALANVTDPDKIDFLFTPDWYVYTIQATTRLRLLRRTNLDSPSLTLNIVSSSTLVLSSPAPPHEPTASSTALLSITKQTRPTNIK
jgi:hypothetical protein